MNRYEIQFKLEQTDTENHKGNFLTEIWYIRDMTPAKGRYPKYVARFYDEALANIALEALNKYKKPLDSFNRKKASGSAIIANRRRRS